MRRRRLTAGEVHPVGRVQHTFDWFDVSGAVAPTTGERFVLEWPARNAARFPLVIDAFAPAFPHRVPLRRVDPSGAHTAPCLQWPDNVRAGGRPPSGPELHPIARV